MKAFVIMAMLFCHVIDDFYFQSGFLVNGKQKQWWKDQSKNSFYHCDYIPCLIAHSIEWTFMIMLPLFWYHGWDASTMVAVFITNVLVHAYTDNAKANRHNINLIQDQLIHMGQIGITAYLFLFVFC